MDGFAADGAGNARFLLLPSVESATSLLCSARIFSTSSRDKPAAKPGLMTILSMCSGSTSSSSSSDANGDDDWYLGKKKFV